MKILLFKSWYGNIGDCFVKIGAEAILKKTFPDAEIIHSSPIAQEVMSQSGLAGFSKYIGDKCNRNRIGSYFLTIGKDMTIKQKKDNIVNAGELTDIDIIVMPGCVLNVYIDQYSKTLKKLMKKGTALVLLGAGGFDYMPKTVRYVRDIMEQLKSNVILISRDSTAYNCYSSSSKYAYDGLDCVFFINDAYDPPKSRDEFIIAAFHKIKEPTIDTPYKIIRPNHFPLTSTFPSTRNIIIPFLAKAKGIIDFNKPNAFISDDVREYLFLYANAKEVHSDLVHACGAALAYSNPAKFYNSTPRAKLLEKVLDEDIAKQLVFVNKYKLEREKEKQICALRNFVSRL